MVTLFHTIHSIRLIHRRWNLTVSDRFRDHIYIPLRNAGFPFLGRLCAFGGSAVLHSVPFYIAMPRALLYGFGAGMFFVTMVCGTMTVMMVRRVTVMWESDCGWA